jgi:WD40 repeat protein/Flp pilus assembly protein TadD
VRVVAFSGDGRLVLTAGDEHLARLWEVEPNGNSPMSVGLRRPRAELPHRAAIRAVAFSPDYKLAATAGDDNTARLWDTATGKQLGVPLAHARQVYDLAFSPDGRTLITCGMDDCARLWNTRTQQAIGGRPLAHEGGVVRVAFSPDGAVVATGSLDHTARLWDARTGQPLGSPLVHKGTVYGLDFSPDGTRLLTGSHDQSARLWDVATSRPLGAPWPHVGLVGFVAFHPDGRSATTGTMDQVGRVWDLPSSEGHSGPILRPHWWVNAIAFTPARDRVLAASTDNWVRAWDVRTGHAAEPSNQLPGGPSLFAFRRDTRAVLVAGYNVARLWAIDDLKPLSPPLQHPDEVTAVALSPDGRIIVTGCNDRCARLWSTEGEVLGKPLVHPHAVVAVAVSPDGKTIVTGCGTGPEPGGEARLWDSATGEPRSPPLRHEGSVRAVAFSADGTLLATGCMDHTIRLWDVASGRPRGGPLHHGARVEALVFRPDGKVLLSGSEDRTARLWDVATGLPLGPPLLQREPVHAVAFDPAGQRFAAGSWDVVQVAMMPVPAPDDPPRVTAWAQATSGLELKERGSVQVLGAPAWQQRRRRLQELGGPIQPAADPSDLLAWHDRQAEQNEASGRWFAALWHLDRLVRASPSSNALRHRQARALTARQQFDQALLAYTRILKSRETDAEAWHGRSRVQEHLGKWNEAAADHLRALQLNPHDVPLQCEQAALRVLAGDLAGYRRLCHDMQRDARHTQNAGVLRFVAWTLTFSPEREKDSQQAVEWAARVDAAHPGGAEAAHVLAAAHYRAGHFTEADRLLRRTLVQHSDWPSQPLNWLLLGLVCRRQGQEQEARVWLRKARDWLEEAARQQPRQPLARYPLADHVDELAFELLRREIDPRDLWRTAIDQSRDLSH